MPTTLSAIYILMDVCVSVCEMKEKKNAGVCGENDVRQNVSRFSVKMDEVCICSGSSAVAGVAIETPEGRTTICYLLTSVLYEQQPPIFRSNVALLFCFKSPFDVIAAARRIIRIY